MTLAAPSNVQATATTAHHVVLTWDAVVGADEYYVERGPSSSGPWDDYIGDGVATTITDTTADEGSTYYYHIVAYNGSEDSAPSTPLSVTVGAPLNGYLASSVAFVYDSGTSFAFSADVLPGDVIVMQAAFYSFGSGSYTLSGTWSGPVSRTDASFDMLTRSRVATESGTVSYTIGRSNVNGAAIQVWVIRDAPVGFTWRIAGISGNATGLRGQAFTSGTVRDPSLRLTLSAGYNNPDVDGTRTPADTSGGTGTVAASGLLQVDVNTTLEYVAGYDQVDATGAATGPEWPNAHADSNAYIGHTILVPYALPPVVDPICEVTDLFNRTGSGDLGTPDSGGSYEYSGTGNGSFDVAALAYVRQTGSGDAVQLVLHSAIVAADAEERIEWEWGDSLDAAALIAMRVQPDYSGYVMSAKREDAEGGRIAVYAAADVRAFDPATDTLVVDALVPIAVDDDTRYQFVAQTLGSTVRAKYYPLDDDPGGWQASATDTTISAPGRIGFGHRYTGSAWPFLTYFDVLSTQCVAAGLRWFGWIF